MLQDLPHFHDADDGSLQTSRNMSITGGGGGVGDGGTSD